MPKLVVLSEGLTGRSHDLKVDKTTIGRLEDNTFQIAEQSVSSHHCEILLKGTDVIVRDLDSTNGTYINGEKISEKVLKPGQILRLGNIEARLEGDGAPTPAAAGAAGASATTAEKKKQNQNTSVIPRGVKFGETDTAAAPKFDKNSPFAKKSNKINMIFLAVGVVLGLAIIIFLVMAFLRVGGGGQ
ncbi:MAG TPA: FHA domain-containing protein [Verrucomicrobiae bacterium]